MRFLIIGLMSLCLAGCSTFMPKRVELFQDKVRAVPEHTAKDRELVREAAHLTAKLASDAASAATKAESPDSVVLPAGQAQLLSKSLSTFLGPPLDPWEGEPALLANKVEHASAVLDRKIDEFRKDNAENVGKKIEGTGLFQVPYFAWLGGAAFLLFLGVLAFRVLSTLAKIYGMSNPPVAIGLKAAQAGGKLLSKGFSQIIAGGEKFKKKLLQTMDESQAKAVIEMFRTSHTEAQDEDVQGIVKGLTK